MPIKYIALIPIVFLSGCLSVQQQSSKLSKTELNEISTLLIRSFETTENAIEDSLIDVRAPINSKDLEGVWFYSQINTGKEGKVYRQRVNHLEINKDGQSVSLTAYTLVDPERFIDAWEHPERLNALTKSDLTNYLNDGCQQNWIKRNEAIWDGYVDPKTCVIDSARRKTQIRIESESIIEQDYLKTTERGYSIDSEFLWGSQPGEYITLNTVK